MRGQTWLGSRMKMRAAGSMLPGCEAHQSGVFHVIYQPS